VNYFHSLPIFVGRFGSFEGGGLLELNDDFSLVGPVVNGDGTVVAAAIPEG